jgi:hypothetical protein
MAATLLDHRACPAAALYRERRHHEIAGLALWHTLLHELRGCSDPRAGNSAWRRFIGCTRDLRGEPDRAANRFGRGETGIATWSSLPAAAGANGVKPAIHHTQGWSNPGSTTLGFAGAVHREARWARRQRQHHQ